MSLLNLICNASSIQIDVIQSNKAEEVVWQKLKDLFVITFDQAYKHVDIKDINNKFNSTSDYLQNLFDVDRKNTENLNFDFILATEKQKVVGYIFSCYCPEDKKAYIHHLVVDTSKHNKGIGKTLIKVCEDWYKEADFISLSARKFNDKAIGFYKYIGFYETDFAPEIAYIIRPNAKNNPQIVNLEKIVTRS
jgi:ribosomal protein S18 acetylase RimI-like enzyme